MIDAERIRPLNRNTVAKGRYVLYWMQASQRASCNHALEHAIALANESKQPLIVFFGLTEAYPAANLRHYRFMLEGLSETQAALADRGIRMVVRIQSPPEGALELAREASIAVVDRGYLRLQQRWRKWAASRMPCPLLQVESDVVVPVETASPKEEYAAATLRPKIARLLDHYLVPVHEDQPRKGSLHIDIPGLDLTRPSSVLEELGIDRAVPALGSVRGGTSQADARLAAFVGAGLDLYAEKRNDPSRDHGSGMSPYLHFGQISPLRIALSVRDAGGPGAAAYLEELVVRRELAMNFVRYNRGYDSLRGLPAWCLTTLREHAGDGRDPLYSRSQLENAVTHDPFWNAAQMEMVATGKMHGYMRMYWGKKIIEWSSSPRHAHRTAVYLNDRYELDGRDPNGYTGILWCFGKHDRAWKERPILGKLRYMSADGLRRKFDMDIYVRRCEALFRSYRDRDAQ